VVVPHWHTVRIFVYISYSTGAGQNLEEVKFTANLLTRCNLLFEMLDSFIIFINAISSFIFRGLSPSWCMRQSLAYKCYDCLVALPLASGLVKWTSDGWLRAYIRPTLKNYHNNILLEKRFSRRKQHILQLATDPSTAQASAAYNLFGGLWLRKSVAAYGGLRRLPRSGVWSHPLIRHWAQQPY